MKTTITLRAYIVAVLSFSVVAVWILCQHLTTLDLDAPENTLKLYSYLPRAAIYCLILARPLLWFKKQAPKNSNTKDIRRITSFAFSLIMAYECFVSYSLWWGN